MNKYSPDNAHVLVTRMSRVTFNKIYLVPFLAIVSIWVPGVIVRIMKILFSLPMGQYQLKLTHIMFSVFHREYEALIFVFYLFVCNLFMYYSFCDTCIFGFVV